MKENLIKSAIRSLFFRKGAIRKIRFGPLQGMMFRVCDVTGMSPWYSGTEKNHQKVFRDLVDTGDTVIDVGANWGIHTLYLSTLVSKVGRVLAFEPFSEAFIELEWHIRKNKCANVNAHQIAIGDNNGKANFFLGNSESTGTLINTDLQTDLIDEPMIVNIRTLDSILEELDINNIKLMKIDVEGAESKVLMGATSTIEKYKPYLVIDLHKPEQDVMVTRFLTERGYKLERLKGPPIKRTDVGWPDPDGVWGSIVDLPSSE